MTKVVQIKQPKFFKGDNWIWGICLVILPFSIWTVFSASRALAYGSDVVREPEHFWWIHLSRWVIAGVCLFAVHHLKLSVIKKYCKLPLLVIVPILFCLIVYGEEMQVAKRSLMGIQPFEIAKFSLIYYLAYALSKRQQKKHKDIKKVFWPIFFPVLLVCGIVVTQDLSTAALIFASAMILMYIGRVKIKYLLSTMAASLFVIFSMIVFQPSGLSLARAETWARRLFPWYTGDLPEQLQRSFATIYHSGFLPKGIGKSDMFSLLPQSHTDFIYAIVIEEYGILAGIFLVFLYLMIAYRGVVIFSQCEDTFGGLLVIGLSFLLTMQALVTMGVTVGLFPVTGLTLPLVSWGGTSLVITATMIGMIQAVSQHVRISKLKKEQKLNAG